VMKLLLGFFIVAFFSHPFHKALLLNAVDPWYSGGGG
jgi:hypothetical protein